MPPAHAVLRLFLLDGSPWGLRAFGAALPGLVTTPLGVEIPLAGVEAEEILSLCVRFGITARATRIVQRPGPE